MQNSLVNLNITLAIFSTFIISNHAAHSVNVSKQATQPLSNHNCIKWAAFSRSLPVKSGRGGQWKAFGDLPPKFQSGCLLLQDNNSVDVAYVLRQGMSIQAYLGKPFNSRQEVPAFNYEKEKALEKLMVKGDALMVTWLTPTNGTLTYVRSIPRNKAFLRKDGMTCLNAVCMKSGAISHEELSRILSSHGKIPAN